MLFTNPGEALENLSTIDTVTITAESGNNLEEVVKHHERLYAKNSCEQKAYILTRQEDIVYQIPLGTLRGLVTLSAQPSRQCCGSFTGSVE